MLSQFVYLKPKTLSEVLTVLDEHAPDSKILAGGTDLFVLLRRNLELPKVLVDIKGLPEMQRLEYTSGQGLFIGAAVTVNAIVESDIIRKKYTALAEAAENLASYPLRNRATVIGNICNASPGADCAGPLLIFDAVVSIVSLNGQRQIPLSDFFTGVKKTVLKPEELVLGVSLPDISDDEASLYLKQTRVKGHDLGIVGLAARLDVHKKFSLAMTAVAPTPIRFKGLEDLLNAQPITLALAELAQREVQKWVHPITDIRATEEYRKHIAGVFMKRAIEALVGQGGKQNV